MSIFIDNYQYEDEQHVINRLKELINPSNENSYSIRGYNNEFLAITRYLGDEEYQLKQFPNILVPPISLKTFSYNQILGTVTWDERRKLIAELYFSRRKASGIEVPSDVQSTIKSIPVSNSEWKSQSDNEKLRIIVDLIENLLRQTNGKFIILADDIFYGFFSNALLKELRKQLQVFRHSNKDAIQARENFDKNKKQFLIHLSVVLTIRINEASFKEENIEF